MSNSHECLSQLLVIEELKADEDWTSNEIVCSEAIAQDAFNANFIVNRGIARTHLHRRAEALEDFDLANSIEPLNRTAILGRARALLNTGLVDVIVLNDSKSDGRTKHFELFVLENLAIEEFNMETSQYGFELAFRKEFQLSANIYSIKDSLFLKLSMRVIDVVIQFYRMCDNFLLWEAFQTYLFCWDMTELLKLLFVDKCDLFLKSNKHTVYQRKENSNLLEIKKINIIEAFTGDKRYSSEREPFKVGSTVMMLLFEISKFKNHSQKAIYLLSAMLRLAINNIFYANKLESIPTFPTISICTVNKEQNSQIEKIQRRYTPEIFTLIQVVSYYLRNDLISPEYRGDVTCFTAEIIYQLLSPICQCKINDGDLKSLNMHDELCDIFSKLRSVRKSPSFRSWQNISLYEVISNLWDKFNDITLLYVVSEKLESLSGSLCCSPFGRLRFEGRLPSPKIYSDPNMAKEWYVDPIRSALHLPVALAVLKPEALVRHFSELQKLAWRSHPLYDPERPPPPHCVVPLGFEPDNPTEGRSLDGESQLAQERKPRASAMLLQTLDLATQNSSPPQLLDSIFTLGEILHARGEQPELTTPWSSELSYLSSFAADLVAEESSRFPSAATEMRPLVSRVRNMWSRDVPEAFVATKRSDSSSSWISEEFISLDVPARSFLLEMSTREVEQPFICTDQTLAAIERIDLSTAPISLAFTHRHHN